MKPEAILRGLSGLSGVPGGDLIALTSSEGLGLLVLLPTPATAFLSRERMSETLVDGSRAERYWITRTKMFSWSLPPENKKKGIDVIYVP